MPSGNDEYKDFLAKLDAEELKECEPKIGDWPFPNKKPGLPKYEGSFKEQLEFLSAKWGDAMKAQEQKNAMQQAILEQKAQMALAAQQKETLKAFEKQLENKLVKIEDTLKGAPLGPPSYTTQSTSQWYALNQSYFQTAFGQGASVGPALPPKPPEPPKPIEIAQERKFEL